MVRLRRVVAATTLLVYLTVLLGVSTKAAGAGLACHARWPVCDGGLLNLFPASVPSAFEWVHRLVAGVTGLAILGTAALAWRRDAAATVRYAATLGLVLTPVQVYLGRQTVLVFSSPILAAHYWVAMGIFGSFALATVAAYRDALDAGHARRALALAVVLVPVQVAVGPLWVDTYSPPVQALHYAVTLALFAAMLVATVAGWPTLDSGRYALAVGLAALPVLVSLGRSVLAAPDLVLVYEGVAVLLFLAVVVAALDERRARATVP